jgi:recombination associated protein RdgC
MLFKNLSIFSIRGSDPFTASGLEQGFERAPFTPCGRLDSVRYGWAPPVPGVPDLLLAGDGALLFCAKREAKLIPPAAIKERVAAKVLQMGRSVCRKERKELAEEEYMAALPTALTTSRLTYAYLDLGAGWLVVNSVGAAEVSDLFHALRQALPGLKLAPLFAESLSGRMGAAAIAGDNPPLLIGNTCELVGPSGRKAAVVGEDAGDVQMLEEQWRDLKMARLGLTLDGEASFILDHGGTFRQVKWAEGFCSRVEDSLGESWEVPEGYRADLFYMTQAVRAIVDAVVEKLGVPA